jgi:MOSC domain-containing protein YiiM
VTEGTVEGIFIAPTAKAPMESLQDVDAITGDGLAGDRYHNGSGTYWKMEKPGQEVTLIEAETLERLAAEFGITLAPGASRRNIVTRGVRLGDLLHKRFAIGPVEVVGIRDCPPCAHLEALTETGVRAALEGVGGLRTDIVVGGRISVGDRIILLS